MDARSSGFVQADRLAKCQQGTALCGNRRLRGWDPEPELRELHRRDESGLSPFWTAFRQMPSRSVTEVRDLATRHIKACARKSRRRLLPPVFVQSMKNIELGQSHGEHHNRCHPP